MKTGLSYKKADKLIYGAVKNLTCILPQKKEDYHEKQHYAVFWVGYGRPTNCSAAEGSITGPC